MVKKLLIRTPLLSLQKLHSWAGISPSYMAGVSTFSAKISQMNLFLSPSTMSHFIKGIMIGKQGFSGLPPNVSLAFLRGRHIYFVKVASKYICRDFLTKLKILWAGFIFRERNFGFSPRHPGLQSQSLCFCQKVNVIRSIFPGMFSQSWHLI